jgi:hypothetical protein
MLIRAMVLLPGKYKKGAPNAARETGATVGLGTFLPFLRHGAGSKKCHAN